MLDVHHRIETCKGLILRYGALLEIQLVPWRRAQTEESLEATVSKLENLRILRDTGVQNCRCAPSVRSGFIRQELCQFCETVFFS